MNISRILSLVHLALAVYGLIINNVLLTVLNLLLFMIMDSNAKVGYLEDRIKSLEDKNDNKSKTNS